MLYASAVKLTTEAAESNGYTYRVCLFEVDETNTLQLLEVFGVDCLRSLVYDFPIFNQVCHVKEDTWGAEIVELDCLSLAEGLEATLVDWNGI